MSKKRLYVYTLTAACAVVSVVVATSQNFAPDVTFKRSDVAGWHKLGDADWRADHGEITGTPKRESGGWLVLDRGYQDLQFFASFRCTGACKSGILLRAEKTAEGMKGIYVSLTEGDLAGYEVVLDAHGAEVSREKLPAGPGPMIRFATARPNGADELVQGFSKLAPTVTEARAAAAAWARRSARRALASSRRASLAARSARPASSPVTASTAACLPPVACAARNRSFAAIACARLPAARLRSRTRVRLAPPAAWTRRPAAAIARTARASNPESVG